MSKKSRRNSKASLHANARYRVLNGEQIYDRVRQAGIDAQSWACTGATEDARVEVPSRSYLQISVMHQRNHHFSRL